MLSPHCAVLASAMGQTRCRPPRYVQLHSAPCCLPCDGPMYTLCCDRAATDSMVRAPPSLVLFSPSSASPLSTVHPLSILRLASLAVTAAAVPLPAYHGSVPACQRQLSSWLGATHLTSADPPQRQQQSRSASHCCPTAAPAAQTAMGWEWCCALYQSLTHGRRMSRLLEHTNSWQASPARGLPTAHARVHLHLVRPAARCFSWLQSNMKTLLDQLAADQLRSCKGWRHSIEILRSVTCRGSAHRARVCVAASGAASQLRGAGLAPSTNCRSS